MITWLKARQAMRALALILSAGVFSAQNSALASDPAGPPVAPFRDERTGGKYGFIDRHGNVVLEPKYDYAASFVGGLAEVRLGDKRGFIDASGQLKFTLPPGTDEATEVSEGRIWFRREKDRKWGVCDDLGKVILEPQYDDYEPFSEEFAAVNLGRKVPFELEFGKWGFINKQGELVIPVQNNYAGSFSEGLARVSDDARTGFIDKNGKMMFEVRGSNVGDFREGLAPVHISPSLEGKDWRTDFIDREGQTKMSVDGWAEEFHEGLAVVVVRGGVAQSNEGKSYGFIDRQGKVVIRPSFGEAYAFHEGLAAVRTKKTTVYGKGDSWGYIDKTGKCQIEPFCNEAGNFRRGVASIHIGGTLQEILHAPSFWEGGEWWLIDTSGRQLKRF